MAFIKDTLDKIILGRWRFLNLLPIVSTNSKILAIDENGNLGTTESEAGEIGEMEGRLTEVENQLEEMSPLIESAVQPNDLSGYATTASLGDLSSKDTIAVPTDITATGTPSATTYLRGDGSWTTPTNTTYTNMTQAEADAGTVTTGRTISALVLETKINNKISTKLTASQGTAVADAVDDTDVVDQFNSLLASLRTAGIIAT